MTWVRLDDQFFANPKVRRISHRAQLLYLAGLCHCAQHLTDGTIAKTELDLLAVTVRVKSSFASELTAAGLWLDKGGEYAVNDFAQYNHTRAEVEERRAAKARAGRKGAQVRWQNDDSRLAEDMADAIAPEMSPAITDEWQTGMPPSHPIPSPSGLHTQSSSTDVPERADDDAQMRLQALAALRRRNTERPDLPAVADTGAWIAGYIRRERLNPTETECEDALRGTPLCGECTNGWAELDDGELERCECRGGPGSRSMAEVQHLHIIAADEPY